MKIKGNFYNLRQLSARGDQRFVKRDQFFTPCMEGAGFLQPVRGASFATHFSIQVSNVFFFSFLFWAVLAQFIFKTLIKRASFLHYDRE